ncbi:hypothetical protein QA645_40495 [Bradyrhizobium sp. CIAT3101]|uniref:hypothetical protein n=1 Tax=Bradyrhizobium sp. CIAT3101 TaxID=439387 RepID=UPI0024B046DA|nr:hypothetical protein [Bradyrhizobium sp. CIAT3101]WFU80645.1 hypothetical protein QA645_40495 [Bradyrhizobium sp. CIAT3101]
MFLRQTGDAIISSVPQSSSSALPFSRWGNGLGEHSGDRPVPICNAAVANRGRKASLVPNLDRLTDELSRGGMKVIRINHLGIDRAEVLSDFLGARRLRLSGNGRRF